MEYKILETHLIFDNEIIMEIVVLWENYGDIEATRSTRNRTVGYYSLKDYDIPTLTLFKKVAGYGMKLNEKQKELYFPNRKQYETI